MMLYTWLLRRVGIHSGNKIFRDMRINSEVSWNDLSGPFQRNFHGFDDLPCDI